MTLYVQNNLQYHMLLEAVSEALISSDYIIYRYIWKYNRNTLLQERAYLLYSVVQSQRSAFDRCLLCIYYKSAANMVYIHILKKFIYSRYIHVTTDRYHWLPCHANITYSTLLRPYTYIYSTSVAYGLSKHQTGGLSTGLNIYNNLG